jgi:hypothetical protein
MRSSLIVAAALLSASLAAHANSISFTASDYIYGAQNGSIANATGSADILYFALAIGDQETIDLTNSLGIVTDTIFSPSGKPNPVVPIATGDEFEFAGIASGNAAIGTTCVASSTVACVVNTGGPINLTSEVHSMSYDGEDFTGTDSLLVTADDTLPAATPEPSSFILLGTGALGIAGILRKRLA